MTDLVVFTGKETIASPQRNYRAGRRPLKSAPSLDRIYIASGTFTPPPRPDAWKETLERVVALEARVALLEGHLEVVDELPESEALVLAREFFEARDEPAYATDLADHLGTSVSQAVDLMRKLEGEGAIAANPD